MSSIERSLFKSTLFDTNVVTHTLLPHLSARETGIFLNAVAANPRLLETEHAPDLTKIYIDSTLRQLKENTPSTALRIAVESKNYLLLKQLLKPDVAFDDRYTLNDAAAYFAAEGNLEGMKMLLQSERRGEINTSIVFQAASPAVISYMLDPANDLPVWYGAVLKRLADTGTSSLPAEKNRQVLEAILSAPGIAHVIGNQFFFLARSGRTQEFFTALDQHLELFTASFERLENVNMWDLWGFSSSGVLKRAREFNCFNILREVIQNKDVNLIVPNNIYHSIYLVSTDWLKDCAARCARAGHAELAQQFRTTIANRNRTCTKVGFALKANVWPKVKTLAERALQGNFHGFMYALGRSLGGEAE